MKYAEDNFDRLKAAVMADPEAKEYFEKVLGGDDEQLRAHLRVASTVIEDVLNPDPIPELMKTKEGRARLFDALNKK